MRPTVGFGTYLLKDPHICEHALECAIENGYRIIDTATFYRNFAPIGKVLTRHPRSHFYLISKAWHDSHTAEGLQRDLTQTLKELHTSYLDAYFLHWPNSAVPIEESLSQLDAFRKKGLIRHIGLSNVTVNHLKRALEPNVPIEWVQVEMHPLFYDVELLSFCKEKGIGVQAWSPLARGRINAHPLLITMSKKYKKSISQIALRWILQNNATPLPCSADPVHIKENRDVNDFIIEDQDMQALNNQARQGQRARITLDRGLGFADEFDYTDTECWPKH